jgi:hypothetical protein
MLSRTDRIYANYPRQVDKAAANFGDHEEMSKGKVLGWIANFSDRDIPIALKVLESIRYYPTSKIRSMVREIVQSVKQDFSTIPWNKIFFIAIGGPWSGSMTIARVLRDTGMIYESNIKHMTELEELPASEVGALVFFDDFCGTGDTLLDWWDVNEPIILPKNAPFALALLVLNGRARRILESFIRIVHIDELDESENVLSSSSSKFTRREKNIISRYCRKTRCETDFVNGYKGCALLLAFKHGCPDNSLPILWKESNDWISLFKRRTL